MSEVLDNIIKRFYREHQDTIGYKEAIEILSKGSVTYLGRQRSLDVEGRGREVFGTDQCRDKPLPQEAFREAGYRHHRGRGSGGDPEIHQVGLHAPLVTEPAMANAAGYWFYGMEVDRG